MFEKDKVLIAPDLKINDLQEKGDSFEEIELMILKLTAENPRNNVFTNENFEPDFLENLRKDERLLRELCKEWSRVEQDPKLAAFLRQLMKNRFATTSIESDS